MPPKKAEEKSADHRDKDDALRYLSRIRENAVSQEEGELLCSDIMQQVVNQAEDQVLANYFDRTAIPYTVQGVCKEILDLVHFVFIARDAGDSTPEAVASWEADAEPAPCPTDTWSRGAVPVRKRAAPLDGRHATPSQRKEGRDKKASYIAKAGDTLTSTPSAGDAAKAARTRDPGRLAGGQGATRATGTPGKESEVPSEAEAPVQDDTDRMQRSEAKKRAELREAAERQHMALKEIKPGKEVVVDSLNGKVIPVKPVDPRRLPNKRLDMKYDVDHDKRDDRRTSRPEVTKPVPQTKKKGGAGKTKWGDHVQPEDTHGPMVVGATPSGGVTLREGDSTQRADIKASKGRMTRAEYKKMLDSMGVSRDPGQAEPDKQKQKDGGGGGAGGRPGPAGGGVPAPTESASKPAAGTGTAAVVQQMPGNRPKFATGTPTDKPPGGYTGGGSNANGAGGGGDGKVNAPAYLKPQPIAPIPQYAHAVAKGDLVVNHRSRKKDLSPRANERLAPLPPPLYPASQGHAGVPEEVEAEAGSPGKASSAAARKKELVHIAQEADGMLYTICI